MHHAMLTFDVTLVLMCLSKKSPHMFVALSIMKLKYVTETFQLYPIIQDPRCLLLG